MSKIVVVGSSNMDMVVKVNHIPRPGETILSHGFFMNCGGKGANQAVAISRLGGELSFVSKIGNDMFGKQILDKLHTEGINGTSIFRDDQVATGMAFISLESNAQNAIVVYPGANATLNKENISDSIHIFQEAELVLVQLEIPIELVVHIAKQAKSLEKKLILNPAPAQTLPDELYPLLYMITPNETEAEILTGIPVVDVNSARLAAQKLRAMGTTNVIITLGAQGAYVLTPHLDELIPVERTVVAKDTTAAGDTFNGAIAVAIANGRSIKEAIVFANGAASLAVTKFGAQSSIPYLAEL